MTARASRPDPPPTTAVVLLSAGVESATLLHQLSLEASGPPGKEPPGALFIDYGQRAAEQERTHSRELCEMLGVTLEHLEIPDVGAAFRLGHACNRHVPIPRRNLFLLATALCWAARDRVPQNAAQTHGARTKLYIALNRDDAMAHPDAAAGFLDHLNALAPILSTASITAPLLAYRKADIIRLGHAQGLDYTRTYSCLLGHRRHCGACPQCRSRRQAFAEANVAEPDDFYRRR